MSINEKLLYHIWDAQHLEKELQTLTARKVSIIFPGHWNREEGPDFRNAIIQIGEETLRGAVEIHVQTTDWIRHEHEENPNFDEVILHVVYKHDESLPVTISNSGKSIEILELASCLSEEITKILERAGQSSFQEEERNCDCFAGLSYPTLLSILEKKGLQRFEKKVNRLKAELFYANYNQIFYQSLFEALGYAKNKIPFKNLAVRLNLEFLQKNAGRIKSAEDLLYLFIKASGLSLHQEKEEINSVCLRPELDELKIKGTLSRWNLFRISIKNHPLRRIMGITDFIYAHYQGHIFNEILTCFSNTTEKTKVKHVLDKLDILINRQTEQRKKYRIGKDRLRIIFLNIMLPLVKIYAGNMGYEKLERFVDKVYREFPGLMPNSIDVTMRKYLDENLAQKVERKSVYQQGVYQVYFDYCQYNLCSECKKERDKILKEL